MLTGLLTAISFAAAFPTGEQQNKPSAQLGQHCSMMEDFGLLIVKMSKQELGQVLSTLRSNQPEGGEQSGESSQMPHSGLQRRDLYRTGLGDVYGCMGQSAYVAAGPSGYFAEGPLGGTIAARPSGYVIDRPLGGYVAAGPSGYVTTGGLMRRSVTAGPSGYVSSGPLGGSLTAGPSGYVATGGLPGRSVTAGPSGYVTTGEVGGSMVSGPSGY